MSSKSILFINYQEDPTLVFASLYQNKEEVDEQKCE